MRMYHIWFIIITIFLCLPRPLMAASNSLIITEFMAANSSTLADEDGDFSDWIEIYNPTASSQSLAGWYLTDDAANLTRWQFPAVTLGPGEYLVVFASDKNRQVAGDELHTNFQLANEGEYLALVEANGTTIASEFAPEFPQQFTDISYGLNPTDMERYFTTPTPEGANNEGILGFVNGPNFSVQRGFYETPFQVEITTTPPDAEIRYTTDGSQPTQTNGALYTGPLNINTTTVLRAAAFKDGFIPSATQTHTYLFLDDVIQQPATIPGYPNPTYNVGGHPTNAFVQHDHEMDPDIVNDPAYSGIIHEALQAIPTLSIAVDPDEIFGNDGFYDATDLEVAASVELIYADNPAQSHQVNAGIESHSHNSLKRSMRLNFRSVYGAGKFESDIFQNAPLNGETAADEFDRIILRAGGNRTWARNWGPDKTAYTIDQFYRDSQIAMSGYGSRGAFTHLYINGIYWGLFNPVERPDHRFTSTYFGGEVDDWFAANHDGEVNGDNSRYNYLKDNLVNKNMTNSNNYAELQEYLDLDNFIDYLILTWWTSTTDWPRNNWYGGNLNGTSPTPFRYFAWDGEWSWDLAHFNYEDNPTDQAWVHPYFRNGENDSNTLPEIWHAARVNDDFMIRFADRVYLHLFHDGALTDANAQERWLILNNFIRDAVVAESARWGDALESLGRPTRTRDVDWQRTVDTTFDLMNGNGAALISVLRNEEYYPNIDPPEFNQHGGEISSGFGLTMMTPNGQPGAIYYTLDGSDPRLPGGAINPSALIFGGSPVTLTGGTVVKTRALNGNEWSALNQAAFMMASSFPLRITEIMYHPAAPTPAEVSAGFTDQDDFEFIELKNVSTQTINLTNVTFTEGITFTFGNVDLGPGQHILVVRNQAAFSTRYNPAGLNIAGVYTGGLDNGGEQLILVDATNSVIHDFSYDDEGGWPTAADGSGSSLEVIDVNGDYNNPANWRASSILNGSPGMESGGPSSLSLRITEIMYHPLEPTPEEIAAGFTDKNEFEFVELKNIGSQTINLANVTFTEGISFTFGNINLTPGQHILLVRNLAAFSLRYGATGFNLAGPYDGALDNAGERITLVDANGLFIHNFQYDDEGAWPLAADGQGSSLEVIDVNGDYNDPANWRASDNSNGSPGESNTSRNIYLPIILR